MTKGKPWTLQEEQQLKRMLQENNSIKTIANTMGKTLDSIRSKMKRLGIEEEKTVQPLSSSNNQKLPPNLPSVEHQLKVLSSALRALREPGINQDETFRLKAIIQGVKIYKELFADYINYSRIETEVTELRKELAKEKAEKTKNMAPN